MSHHLSARLAGLLAILLLSGCAVPSAGQTDVPAQSGSAGEPDVYSVMADVSWVEGDVTVEQEPPVEESTENQPTEVIRAYDFSQPVPESVPVDNSYFADAAFVGDSRTDGFMIYSGIGCGENLTSNGISIFRLGEKKVFKREGVSYTLLEALALKEYGKVYLSLGVNELGVYDDEGFYQAYCDTIDTIRSIQPNAVIYIQGLIPLNEQAVADAGGAAYLKNDHLLVYNELMKKAAQEKRVAFLDLNPEFADENGQLPEGASRDGVHLKSGPCKQWLEYLKTHTVEFETLYPQGEEVYDWYETSDGALYDAGGDAAPDGLRPSAE